MELHKSLVTISNPPSFADGPIGYFERAREFAYANYSDEIQRISSVRLEDITPHVFFHEYIWTVHTTGFSAKAVGKFFARLVEAYGRYDIFAIEDSDDSFPRIRVVCNNPQKIKAVQTTARLMHDGIKKVGWESFREQSLSSPENLQKLPYVGKITCFHLARNIGLLESVKPDLHLVRMANHWRIDDCNLMCRIMRDAWREKTGEILPLGIIDLILWYAASTFGTIGIQKEGQR